MSTYMDPGSQEVEEETHCVTYQKMCMIVSCPLQRTLHLPGIRTTAIINSFMKKIFYTITNISCTSNYMHLISWISFRSWPRWTRFSFTTFRSVVSLTSNCTGRTTASSTTFLTLQTCRENAMRAFIMFPLLSKLKLRNIATEK